MKLTSFGIPPVSGFTLALALILAAPLTGWSQADAQAQPDRPPGREGGPGRGGRGGGPGGFLRMLPIMQALDSDQDGELSAAEIEGAVAALKKLDKNKDGKLSADELRPAGGDGPRGGMDRRPDPTETVNRLMAADKNADGKLSADELPERMKALMTRGDANKDGFLSREELTALMASEGGPRGGQGGEGGRRGEPRNEGQPR